MSTRPLGFCFSPALLRRDVSGEGSGAIVPRLGCAASILRSASEGAYGIGRSVGDGST